MSKDIHVLWDLINLENVKGIYPTGSREICDPAPTDTDYDVVCLVDEFDWDEMENIGFELTSSDEAENYEDLKEDFQCFRNGEINLIVTDSQKFYDSYVEATKICKSLNVLEKEKRIEIFQTYLYGTVVSF